MLNYFERQRGVMEVSNACGRFQTTQRLKVCERVNGNIVLKNQYLTSDELQKLKESLRSDEEDSPCCGSVIKIQ